VSAGNDAHGALHFFIGIPGRIPVYGNAVGNVEGFFKLAIGSQFGKDEVVAANFVVAAHDDASIIGQRQVENAVGGGYIIFDGEFFLPDDIGIIKIVCYNDAFYSQAFVVIIDTATDKGCTTCYFKSWKEIETSKAPNKVGSFHSAIIFINF